MLLLSDKHTYSAWEKPIYYTWKLPYKTKKLLIMTYTLRYLENLKNLQYTVITY